MAAVGRLACPTLVSHKMGQLEIMRRRSDVECWLGALRHHVMLVGGVLTLPLLGRVVDDWIHSAR